LPLQGQSGTLNTIIVENSGFVIMINFYFFSYVKIHLNFFCHTMNVDKNESKWNRIVGYQNC
jgi:hypothetical protein